MDKLRAPEKTCHVFSIVFTLLVLVNAPHLMDPPYWDAILGFFNQSTWLSRHGFQFKLFMQQPECIDGGPRYHLLNGFALLIAGFQSFLRPPMVFLAAHLVILLLSALCATVFFQILRTRLSDVLAAMWVLAVVSNPIWSGQTISLYLEIPMTAMLSVSCFFFWKRWYAWASVFCLIAYFMKNGALLQAAVYGALALGLVGLDGYRKHPFTKNWSLLSLAVPAPLMFLLDHWIQGRHYPDAFQWERIPFCIARTFYLAPRLYPTLALEGLVLAGWAGRAAWNYATDRPIEESYLPDQRFCVFLGMLVVAFWAAFMMTFSALVRYTVMVQLPMACLLAILLSRNPKGSSLLAGLLILLNLLTQHGQWMGASPTLFGRSGDWLERSREYLVDLDADRRLCRWLGEKAAGEPIVVKWPFTQMLRIPELGYVGAPVANVVEGSTRSLLGEALDWKGVAAVSRQRKTLCVYAPSVFENEGLSLRPRKGDFILWLDRSLPAALVIYERQWTTEELQRGPAG